MKKLMKNTRRLIFTICAMCFTVCVIVAGVLATATASFTIKTGASFTASGTLNASVQVQVTNYGNGNSNSGYATIHNGSNEEIHLGTQVFRGKGEENRIVFKVEVSNYGEGNVRADLSELTGTSSISIAYDYKVRTQSGDTVTSDKQHAVVYNNETLTIEITCILIDDSVDINIPINFNFNLTETTDTRDTETIPDTGLYVKVNKKKYNVGESIDSLNDLVVYYNGQPVSGFTLSEVDMSTGGSKAVTVTYIDPSTSQSYSYSYTITIIESASGDEISSITINGKQITEDNVKADLGKDMYVMFLGESDFSSNLLTQQYEIKSGYYISVTTYKGETGYPYGLSEMSHQSSSSGSSGTYTAQFEDVYTFDALSKKKVTLEVKLFQDGTTEAIRTAIIVIMPTLKYVTSISIDYLNANEEMGTETISPTTFNSSAMWLMGDSIRFGEFDSAVNYEGYFMGGPTAKESDFEGIIPGDNTRHDRQLVYRGFSDDTPRLLRNILVNCPDNYFASMMSFDEEYNSAKIESGWNYIQVYIYDMSTNDVVESFEIEFFMPAYLQLPLLGGYRIGMSGWEVNVPSTFSSFVEANDGSPIGASVLYYTSFQNSDSNGNYSDGKVITEIYDSTKTNKLTGFTGLQDYHNFYYIKYTHSASSTEYYAKIDIYINPYSELDYSTLMDFWSKFYPKKGASYKTTGNRSRTGNVTDDPTCIPPFLVVDESGNVLLDENTGIPYFNSSRIKFAISSIGCSDLSTYATSLSGLLENIKGNHANYDSSKTYKLEVVDDNNLDYTIYNSDGSVNFKRRIYVEYFKKLSNADIRAVVEDTGYMYDFELPEMTLDESSGIYKNSTSVTLYNDYIFPILPKDSRAIMATEDETTLGKISIWGERIREDDYKNVTEKNDNYVRAFMIQNVPEGQFTFKFFVLSSDGTTRKDYELLAYVTTQDSKNADFTVKIGNLTETIKLPINVTGNPNYEISDTTTALPYISYVNEISTTGSAMGVDMNTGTIPGFDHETMTATAIIEVSSRLFARNLLLVAGSEYTPGSEVTIDLIVDDNSTPSSPEQVTFYIEIKLGYKDYLRIPTVRRTVTESYTYEKDDGSSVTEENSFDETRYLSSIKLKVNLDIMN